MRNNKWKFIGVIGQVHDLDAKRLVFETKEIQDKTVVKTVVDMHNEGKGLRDIDEFLLDANCTQEEREYITETIYAYFESEYEFRAVCETDGEIESIPLKHVNVGERHGVTAIGLYKNLNDGTQEHILDIDHRTIKKWNGLFLGLAMGDVN